MADDLLVELVRSVVTTRDAGFRISPEGLRRVLRENRQLVLAELGGERVGQTTAFYEPADDMWLFPVEVKG